MKKRILAEFDKTSDNDFENLSWLEFLEKVWLKQEAHASNNILTMTERNMILGKYNKMNL